MSITLIIGCMSSSKTTTLLGYCKRFEIAHRKVIYVKPCIDTRSKYISTHDNIEKECIIVDKLGDIKKELIDNCDVIGIDELQFFSDSVEFCDNMANIGKKVIACGLDSDYMRNPFTNVTNLIAKAETVIKLTAVCDYCGSDAIYSKRKDIDNKDQILIGGKNLYIACCRKCFNSK